jgi:iron(III) transport system ATP-binding protein
MSSLEIDRLSVRYPGQDTPAVENVSMSLDSGDFGVLLGPSGCGKTTLLSAVSGLVRPTTGRISIAGRCVVDAEHATMVPPDKRDIGVVFQSYALWPHLRVEGNVSFPLKRRGVKGAAAERRTHEVLALVGCENLARRYPAELSGGQQQRVALARALAAEAAVVLFDEPLSNLDAELRRRLRDELSRLQADLGFTALYVTHDQSEAFGLGTKIFVMDSGRIAQAGAPQEVYFHPGSAYVASFFSANLFPATVSPGDGSATVTCAAGLFIHPGVWPSSEAVLAIYPERLSLRTSGDGPGTVVHQRWLGPSVESIVALPDGSEVRVSESPDVDVVEAGQRVQLLASPADVHLFPAPGPAHGRAGAEPSPAYRGEPVSSNPRPTDHESPTPPAHRS